MISYNVLSSTISMWNVKDLKWYLEQNKLGSKTKKSQILSTQKTQTSASQDWTAKNKGSHRKDSKAEKQSYQEQGKLDLNSSCLKIIIKCRDPSCTRKLLQLPQQGTITTVARRKNLMVSPGLQFTIPMGKWPLNIFLSLEK